MLGLVAAVGPTVEAVCATGAVPQATVTIAKTRTHMVLAMIQVSYLQGSKKQTFTNQFRWTSVPRAAATTLKAACFR